MVSQVKSRELAQMHPTCSAYLLLLFVFVLVLFTLLASQTETIPIKTTVKHPLSLATAESKINSTKMEIITPDTDLEYQFKVEDLIAEGRTTNENMEEIRTFVSNLNDKYVPSRIQDELILIFLISCANDVALTKKTILSYYDLKKHGPEIYDDRNLERSDIQLALNTVHMSSIPVRTDDNDVVHYFNLHDTNYRNFELVPIMKISYMLMDVAQEKNPPTGLIVIIDMKGASLMHMSKIKMGAIKKYLHFLQEGFPMKLKTIHILNSTYFVDKLLALVKVFMKSELMSMLQIHPPGVEKEKLFQLIPKKCLPKEYGGDLPSESELHQRTLDQLKTKQKFWDMEEKLRKLAIKDEN